MTGRRLAVHTGMAAIRAYELELFGRLIDGLAGIPGVRLWGIADRSRFEERTPTAALTIEGVTAERASTLLGSAASRPGGATSTPTGLIQRLGLQPEGVLRIGLTHYNTAEEVDRLLTELADIASGVATAA